MLACSPTLQLLSLEYTPESSIAQLPTRGSIGYLQSLGRKNGAAQTCRPDEWAGVFRCPPDCMGLCVAGRSSRRKLTFRSVQVPSPPSDGLISEGGLNEENHDRPRG